MQTHLVSIFSMGGYGLYVWSSYSIALLLMMGLLANSILKKKQVYAKLKFYALRKASSEKK